MKKIRYDSCVWASCQILSIEAPRSFNHASVGLGNSDYVLHHQRSLSNGPHDMGLAMAARGYPRLDGADRIHRLAQTPSGAHDTVIRNLDPLANISFKF
jgi:hypothetical protein